MTAGFAVTDFGIGFLPSRLYGDSHRPVNGKRLPSRTRMAEAVAAGPESPAAATERLGGFSRSLSLGTLEQPMDIVPESLPFLPLGLGELGESSRVADAGEVGVLLPVLHLLPYAGAVNGLAIIELLGAPGQFSAEPAEGLLSQAGPLGLVKRGGVLTLAGSGERREAGGVVAMGCRLVVGQFGVGGEGVAEKAGGGVVPFLDSAPFGQAQAARRLWSARIPLSGNPRSCPGRPPRVRGVLKASGHVRASGRVRRPCGTRRWPRRSGPFSGRVRGRPLPNRRGREG